ncbi:serine/threonine-protein kinase [Streptomyces sp. NPDC054835]|uniref:serine/threonine-protein kinase n=1 Tax=Streptomyces sp. NBC_01268 TaxID=2903806 RepID=UPI002E34032F|nr:serine/threonine-protein kinase [Streptomyces sp. NBC_01268]
MTVIAGRYRLLDVLGEGGMGTVWRARDEVLGREVAVKEVRAPAGLPAEDRERLYARLEREAWAAARVSHRSAVTVYDVVTEDGRPWIVMELVRGLTLAETLEAEGPLPPRRAAQVGADVLAALRAAHGAGVLHRDVKPANVLLANDGRVVLTDFGIAAVAGTSPLTMTGELIGSPEYLAPERAMGRTPGLAADLWSLGVLLYAAVEGASPFRRDTALDTLRAVVDEEPVPPERAGPLAPVIEGLLRKDPEQRMSAEEAEERLRVIGAGGTPGAGPTRAETYGPFPAPLPGAGGSGGGTRGSDGPGGPYGPSGPGATTPLPAPGGPPPGSEPGERRRGRTALVAGIVALLLVGGGLTYALLRDENPTPPPAPPETTSAPATETTTPEPTPTTATTPPSTPASTPATSVVVSVRADRARYEGACPPPQDQAPAFTATFTVGGTPASVSYRWITESGEGQDGTWRTLEFAAGGPTERQVTRIQAVYRPDGTLEDRIGVEVRSPVTVRSGLVAFSVTCEKVTPTGGATTPTSPPATSSAGTPAPGPTPRP